MSNFDPANDRLDVYSESLGQHAEVTGYTVVDKVLQAGSNITLTPNASTGTITIAATGGASLPANAAGFLYNNGSGALSWVTP